MSDASNLLAHEAAFALGQMQDVAAIPALCTVLQDTSSFHPIVRHEVSMYVCSPCEFFSWLMIASSLPPFFVKVLFCCMSTLFLSMCFRGSKMRFVYFHV